MARQPHRYPDTTGTDRRCDCLSADVCAVPYVSERFGGCRAPMAAVGLWGDYPSYVGESGQWAAFWVLFSVILEVFLLEYSKFLLASLQSRAG